MNPHRYVFLAALTMLTLACSSDAPTALTSEISPVAAMLSQPCTTMRGSAADVQHDFKALHARLEGDAAGTLQILEHSQVQLGAVQRAAAVYALDLETGAVVFGDGTAGRVPPSGGVESTAYRYHAQGRISGGTGPYSDAHGQWEIKGWLSTGAAATSLDYHIVLCIE